MAKKSKFYKPDTGSDKPDLTPMIDVIFLLIIFFLIAGGIETTVRSQGQIQLRQGAQEDRE